MAQVRVGARFKLVAHKDGNSRDLTPWFNNLVLDQGLNLMGTGSWFTHCHVGSGNSVPTELQSALDSSVAVTSTVNSDTAGESASAPYYCYRRKVFRFAAGTFDGVNLGELALGNASTIWNRAQIKDNLGDPTIINVLIDEVLDVIAEVRFYANESDVTGTLNL
ncbi:MAG: hypothetical protein VXW65_05270, partial [Pseudomonadota bacterium]|nr:hypothetical protein [Pseudomonadota bacterium]